MATARMGLFLCTMSFSTALEGWVVLDNAEWYFNKSYIEDISMIPERMHIMPADFYTTGIVGQLKIMSEVSCDVKVTFIPNYLGLFYNVGLAASAWHRPRVA